MDARDGYGCRQTVQLYLQALRPWHSLYGVHLRAPAEDVELAPIQKLIPEELLVEILRLLPTYTLGKVAVVCRQWRGAVKHPSLWEKACRTGYGLAGWELSKRLVREEYENSWYSMWLSRPRLRTDGIYVSRNTYIRPGVTFWQYKNPVHLVVYFRYYKFRSDGSFRYKTTPERLNTLYKTFQARLTPAERHKRSIYDGRYVMDGTDLHVAITYPGRRPTEVRTQLELRSTCPGAMNRLDILSLSSSSRAEGAEEEEEGGGGGVIQHKRGMGTCAFVPWDECEDHILNLPIDKMDYWMPG